MATLLSTKILNTTQQENLLNAGIKFSQYDAIQIIPVDFGLPSKIENAIFTSQNTVKQVINRISAQNNSLLTSAFVTEKKPTCFCVGKKTKSLLEENACTVIAWAEYGKDLAELILEKFSQEKFVFFCGNRRREELPSILRINKIYFQEICTYQTELVPKQFHQDFEQVLFFSPSGVESFCLQNKLTNRIAICIGTTTAKEAQKHTDKVIIAEEPTVESVVQTAILQNK